MIHVNDAELPKCVLAGTVRAPRELVGRFQLVGIDPLLDDIDGPLVQFSAQLSDLGVPPAQPRIKVVSESLSMRSRSCSCQIC